MYRWRATYRWKAFDKGYNFASDFISIGGLCAKLWGPKVAGVAILVILRFPFGSPSFGNFGEMGVLGQNVIWMWASWRGTKYIIRGKVVVSPKSRPW